MALDLHLLVRYVHVAAMALMLGGALLLWGLSVRAPTAEPDAQRRLLRFGAQRYELLFWLALGVIVMTGVGNLGAFGAALPNVGTAWGTKFILKLGLVLLLVLLSLARMLFVARLGAAQPEGSPAAATLCRNLYGGTTMFVLAILFLAVALAHGG
jgi:uncharacterized membrane protein